MRSASAPSGAPVACCPCFACTPPVRAALGFQEPPMQNLEAASKALGDGMREADAALVSWDAWVLATVARRP